MVKMRLVVTFCIVYQNIDPKTVGKPNWLTVFKGYSTFIKRVIVNALASFFEWLVVFKRLSTWAITGSLDTGYQVVPVLAASAGKRIGIGCIAVLFDAGRIASALTAAAWLVILGLALVRGFRRPAPASPGA